MKRNLHELVLQFLKKTFFEFVYFLRFKNLQMSLEKAQIWGANHRFYQNHEKSTKLMLVFLTNPTTDVYEFHACTTHFEEVRIF
jgi:hypothetical protein